MELLLLSSTPLLGLLDVALIVVEVKVEGVVMVALASIKSVFATFPLPLAVG